MPKKQNGAGLLRNVFRVLSANFWVAIIGFAGSFVFPRILTIDDYALYHTFTLYLTYITILHLGFPSGMVINYAGKHYDEIDRSQYRTEIKIIGCILAFFTVLFFALSVILKNKMLAYIALAIIPYDLIGSYGALMQAWTQFKKYSVISTFVATAIPVLAFLYYVMAGILPGDVYIIIYLAVYWSVTVFVLYEIGKKIRGVRSYKVFSKTNLDTEKAGVAIVLGNYINTLFVSADKQFIKWFFGASEFAFYSFGMSMQALMTVFITSIAQPLFPAMAQGKFKDEEYNGVKELLFIFGSLSGCAYFATSYIICHFIPKYMESLNIIGIYFLVFPAMAVVNCLYINLYKIKNLMKKYVATLAGILIIAVFLNSMFIYFYHEYTGVSIATTITYYIWLFLGFKQFKFLQLKVKDIGYLAVYTIGFICITRRISNELLGIVIYFVFIMALVGIFYHDRAEMIFKYIKKERKRI